MCHALKLCHAVDTTATALLGSQKSPSRWGGRRYLRGILTSLYTNTPLNHKVLQKELTMRTRYAFAAVFVITVIISLIKITQLRTHLGTIQAAAGRIDVENSQTYTESKVIFKEKSVDGHKYVENRKILQKPRTLLTLFTTFKEIRTIAHHKFAINLVLMNWPLFKPHIQLVVFLNFTNSSLAQRARMAGWDVLPLGRRNPAGTPFLKDMYLSVFDKYDSLLYGYANGDMVFDLDIVKTLKAVEQQISALNDNVLLVGRRTNVLVDLKSGYPSEEEFDMNSLSQLALHNGTLSPEYSIDYFIFTKDGSSMNWSRLADVVIGRPLYDTYMIASALRQSVNVIDCTKTLLAVHISEKGISSHGVRNADSRFNFKSIGPNFKQWEGFTSRAKLATSKDFAGNVIILQRKI